MIGQAELSIQQCEHVYIDKKGRMAIVCSMPPFSSINGHVIMYVGDNTCLLEDLSKFSNLMNSYPYSIYVTIFLPPIE
ncbi:unnamed protein product [Gordionus sp. m RMFG-2023]